MELNNKQVMVAGSNANGEADFFVCTVEVSDDQLNNGVHYDLAKALAEKDGFEAPFVYFDDQAAKNIARQVSKLDWPIPFVLEEQADGKEGNVSCSLHIGLDGVTVQLDGYSDHHDNVLVAFLEYWDGSVNLRAYADINIDEPTHSISREVAKNEYRDTEDALLSGPSIKAKDLWSKLGDIPVLENGEIEEEFLHFEIGTDRETIWDWFEFTFNLSVAKDLMGVSK
jgi:hypothetical protein